jgi:hypothetical protein
MRGGRGIVAKEEMMVVAKGELLRSRGQRANEK